MRCVGWVGPFAAVVIVGLGARAAAASIQLGHSRAEFDAVELRAYEQAVRSRDRDPTKFDQVHPLGGRLLSNEQVYEKLLREWKEDPARFELEHRCVWHVLAGDEVYHEMHPVVPVIVPVVEPVLPQNIPPGGGGGPDNGIHTASVPEPSSLALVVSVLTVLLLAAVCRRVCARFKSPRAAAA